MRMMIATIPLRKNTKDESSVKKNSDKIVINIISTKLEKNIR